MSRRRLARVVAAMLIVVPGAMVVTAPPVAAATVCEYHETPPPAPTSPTPGYVLWSPPTDTTTPNTIIGYVGDYSATPENSTNPGPNCASDTYNAPSHVDVAPAPPCGSSARTRASTKTRQYRTS